MPLVATRGAASAQGFGEFAQQTAANYIEDVFQTWLYTGNGSTQTITNGIDLSGKGGLVWTKSRTATFYSQNNVFDTARGNQSLLFTESTNAALTGNLNLQFNSDGFANTPSNNVRFNDNGVNYVSWTFRKQPKFFDVVTYTGTGSARTTVSYTHLTLPTKRIV